MDTKTVIIVLGKPASGKTSLAEKLSEALDIPHYGIDTFKEIIFNRIGWKDLGWSRKVRQASMQILEELIKSEVPKCRSLIIEGSFKVEVDKSAFELLMERYHFTVVEILCDANGELLFERFKSRVEKGQRHPGHRDRENMNRYKHSIIYGEAKPLGLGPLIRINTEDPKSIDMDALVARIRELIPGV